MVSIVRADIWQDTAGTPMQTVIGFQTKKWQDLTSTTSTSYVDVTGSSFTYTPKRPNSLLIIQGEISMSPINSTNQYTGQNYALFVNGVEQGRQINAHEVYASIGSTAPADIYVGHCVKTVFYTVSSVAPLTIKAMTRVYNTTNITGRINQGNQWESYIHVWEIAQ